MEQIPPQEPIQAPSEDPPLPPLPIVVTPAYVGPDRRSRRRLSQEAFHRQEVVSSWTHAVGALASVAALWLLVVEAARYGTPKHLFSFTVFGCTLVILYVASTLMHALPKGKYRRIMGEADLAGIFFMIAGTYTPFTLITLRGAWGWTLFSLVWALALGGTYVLHRHKKEFERWAAWIYLAMGWLIVLAIKPLAQVLPRAGLLLLIGGGLAYSLGVIFFFWKRFLHHHAIWHIFVMLGSLLHFLAIFLYVLPDMRADGLP